MPDAHLNDQLLDDKLAELEKVHAWSPRVISKLEALIRASDEYSLFRISPLQFAQERGLTENEAMDLFLYAAKIGLFEMDWHLICPVCAHVVESVSSLNHVHSRFLCNTCFAESTATMDDSIQVTFTISPSVRDIVFHHPGSLTSLDLTIKNHWPRGIISDPGGFHLDELWTSYTRLFEFIQPGETRSVEFEAEYGTLHLLSDLHVGTVAPFFLVGEPIGNELQTLEFRLSAGKFNPVNRKLAPVTFKLNERSFTINESGEVNAGPVRILVTSEMEAPGPLWIVNLPMDKTPQQLVFPPFLSGKRLLTNQTFRDLFRFENAATEALDVKDITFLFTDLKGSTELYDQIGDPQAYFLVRQHFEMLESVVALCSGALVKTIGDAVMASFMTPLDATRAAVAMLNQIQEFNRGISAKLILKIGIHKGHSIVVTLNDRIDYFGQTVNIASRVQGLADGSEMCLTEDVYDFPGVGDLLHALRVSAEQAALKGVSETMKVYRVAMQVE